MAKNGEDLMIQKEFEREECARPTKEQVEIAMLEQQLQHAQNTIGHLDDYIDKQTIKIDRINAAIHLYETGKRKEGITLDDIIHIMRGY